MKTGLDDYLRTHSVDDFKELPCTSFDDFDNFDNSPKDISENVIPEYSFPFDIFPEKLQEVIKNYSEALSVEPEIIAHNMLVLASAAIGNSVRIESKSSHVEPLSLWGALIQPTGLGKTHAINALMKPIENKHAEAYQKHLKDLKKYKEYLRQSKENKKNQKKTIRKGKENDY